MIFDWTSTAALGSVRDLLLQEPLTLSGEGLWICLVSSGNCTASLPVSGPSPVGSALILPPQSIPAGRLILSRAPLALAPEGECHLLCLQLTGQAAELFLAGLTTLPFAARGETCPAAAELMGQLAAEAGSDDHSRVRSQLAFALLCELSGADRAAPALPPLVAEAIADIRENYAGLYGVEELSERLGVSKSHLVRTFTRWTSLPASADSPGPITSAGSLKKRPATPPHSGGPWPVMPPVPAFPPRKASGNRSCSSEIPIQNAKARKPLLSPSPDPRSRSPTRTAGCARPSSR